MSSLAAFALAGGLLFASNEALHVTLEGPIRQLIRMDEPHDFQLRHGDRAVPVEVSLRGKSRREFCAFPPLRLRFANPQDGIFAGQTKLKLVTHCNDSPASDSNVIEEYLAYRILNQITTASFRVRLLEVTYEDARSRRTLTKPGFVIEDIDALAGRLGGKHVEPKAIPRNRLDIEHATRVHLFQYLIGNSDYSLLAAPRGEQCCHNAKLIEAVEATYAVPYDFDMTGLVNPKYPGLDTVSRGRGLRVREYRGFCVEPDVLEAAIKSVESEADEIRALFESVPGFDGRRRRVALNYVEGFFREMQRAKRGNFGARCR